MIVIDSEQKDAYLQEIAEAAFRRLALSGNALVELNTVTEDEIRDLNRSTRGVDRVTDVLSYPSVTEIKPFTQANYPFEYDADAGAVNVGSIVICSVVAQRQAEDYGHSVLRENGYLFLHGLLHLLGYDHITADEQQKMRAVEEAILSDVGLTRDV